MFLQLLLYYTIIGNSFSTQRNKYVKRIFLIRSFYWLTSAVHWLLCSNDSIQRPDVCHYTKTKTRKKTITGLRAAKQGNKFAQNGTIRDWRAVVVTVGMKGEDRQTRVCCVSEKSK